MRTLSRRLCFHAYGKLDGFDDSRPLVPILKIRERGEAETPKGSAVSSGRVDRLPVQGVNLAAISGHCCGCLRDGGSPGKSRLDWTIARPPAYKFAIEVQIVAPLKKQLPALFMLPGDHVLPSPNRSPRQLPSHAWPPSLHGWARTALAPGHRPAGTSGRVARDDGRCVLGWRSTGYLELASGP